MKYKLDRMLIADDYFPNHCNLPINVSLANR